LCCGLGACGDFQLNDTQWPRSDTGSSVSWNTVQTGHLIPVYAFFGYEYYSQPVLFELRGNPRYGGIFGDDSVPAILDPIAAYGTIGFDMDGQRVCPSNCCIGACCAPEGTCTTEMPQECTPPSVYMGDDTTCDPNPCPQPQPGACCALDGTCTFVPQLQCTGTYLGDGVPCDPNPCLVAGACCWCSPGECTLTIESDCSWIWAGPGIECDPYPCVGAPFGACCLPSGDCYPTGFAEFCDGVFIACVRCNPNPCSPVPVQPTTWGRIKARYH
jgi:hypothetical protein